MKVKNLPRVIFVLLLVANVATAAEFTGKVVTVADGDTITAG